MSDIKDNKYWEDKLSTEEYKVLRDKGTEPAFTSPLNDEKREGVFECAACGEALFSSDHKYNSGSGWPSFYAPTAEGVLAETTDHNIGYARTEVHCAKCGGHMGHVFPDGPKPTGLRFCVNGTSLKFKEK